MKGYIYTMFAGADPGVGWNMTDPIFGRRPTLGACMPNIRRFVEPGDQIFVISGRVTGVQQYIVGGFAVDEKIHALAAYERFPENRQSQEDDGTLRGNIIVGQNGQQNAIDYHGNFERRLENYIIGRDPVVLETPAEIALGRERSLALLQHLFARDYAQSITGVIGRFRKMNDGQIEELRGALSELKAEARDARR
ncbi:hypothetical protein [Burkholderia sp. S-53]|uniref:hypothetical protein n=1 Tax=Burkholderia sp. S-53 TaxID=2906514 RepID=UPI0021D0AB22|nr:hypothetical protein [Burkholderia sp. S-53]UXU92096.1 hypothetical protein LXM88_28535 [Burkholderia sp. S-53]